MRFKPLKKDDSQFTPGKWGGAADLAISELAALQDEAVFSLWQQRMEQGSVLVHPDLTCSDNGGKRA